MIAVIDDEPVHRSWSRRVVGRLGVSGTIGAVVMSLWIVAALAWRHITPHDPFDTDVVNTLAGPSVSHPFGTDQLGRDVFSRVLAGAEDTLSVAPLATAIGLVVGVTIGLVAGYRRGIIDSVAMRTVDAIMAFPAIVTTILLITMVGRSRWSVAIVIGLLFAPPVARTIRGVVLAEGQREYVSAARLLGVPARTIMVREVLPNVVPTIAVEATVRLGYAVFAEATLSFLGLGLQPPSPALGVLVAENRGNLQLAPLTVLGPAIAIASIIVAANLVAERVGPT